jgi:hypothetical protein
MTGILTQQERADLHAVGFSDEQIDVLTSAEAKEIVTAASVVTTNLREVREFIEIIVTQARSATKDIKAPGVLQMIRMHPLDDDDDDVVVYRYKLDDPNLVGLMTKDAVDASNTGHNIYVETRLVRPGLRANARGKKDDTVAVFALAVDSDADKGKAWMPTARVSLDVKTSPGNDHFWFFFERAIDWKTADKLGEGLRKATGGDADTGVITQPFRVAGTINYPGKKKQARGRTEIVPTSVRGFDPASLWTPESFEQEFPPSPTPMNGGGNGQSTSEPDESSIPDETLEAIKSTEKGDRGNILWNVVQTLREDGWTVDGIITLLGRYPNGLARKFKGRLRREVERTWGKLARWQQGPSPTIAPPPIQPPPPPPPPPGAGPGAGPAASGPQPQQQLLLLDAAHATFKKWLGKGYDTGVLNAVLAAAAAEKLTGDPLWLLVISGSANAKTETVRSLAGAGALITSTITSEGALLSATARSRGATGGLLKKMGTRGTLVIKDMTSLLEMDVRARGLVLAALREVYDGKWERNVGTGGGRTLPWEGRIAVVGACTTAWDAAHSVIAVMGERFVIVRADSEVGRVRSAVRAIGNTGQEVAMRTELADAVKDLIAGMNTVGYRPTRAETKKLIKLANIVTWARTAVHRDYRGEVVDAHALEMPTRFSKQLTQLVRGAVAIGLSSEEAMRLARRGARNTIPPLRRRILLDLAAHPKARAFEVARRITRPRTTVRRELEALHVLGALVCDEQDVRRGYREEVIARYSLAPGLDRKLLLSL